MKKLTFVMENYLEAIYELSSEGKGARVSDIAERLGVTKASTNSAMTTLSERGLIINEKYKEVLLTEEGRRFAELTAQKHHIIKRFLEDVLSVDAAIADEGRYLQHGSAGFEGSVYGRHPCPHLCPRAEIFHRQRYGDQAAGQRPAHRLRILPFAQSALLSGDCFLGDPFRARRGYQ